MEKSFIRPTHFLGKTMLSETQVLQIWDRPEEGLMCLQGCLLSTMWSAGLVKDLISSYKFCLAYSLTPSLLQRYWNNVQNFVLLFKRQAIRLICIGVNCSIAVLFCSSINYLCLQLWRRTRPSSAPRHLLSWDNIKSPSRGVRSARAVRICSFLAWENGH